MWLDDDEIDRYDAERRKARVRFEKMRARDERRLGVIDKSITDLTREWTNGSAKREARKAVILLVDAYRKEYKDR